MDTKLLIFIKSFFWRVLVGEDELLWPEGDFEFQLDPADILFSQTGDSWWTLVACLVWQPAVYYEFPFLAGEHLLRVWYGNRLSVMNFLFLLVNTCCMFGMATYCLL